MKTKNWFILTGLVFVVLGILALRPVPTPDEKDCLTLTGTVTEVYESGAKDVVFKIEESDKEFYVNRGLDRGLDLAELRSELTNKKIVIKYPEYWTPLDPTNSMRHISKIECEGRVVFTEMEGQNYAQR